MTESISHSEVLRRLSTGGDDAVADLYSMSRERLRRLVSFRLDARLKGRVDPDDILQEAYLDAVQRIDHFIEKPETTIFVWFRMIVMQSMTNVYRRHLGTKKRDPRKESPLGRQRSTDPTVDSMTDFLTGHLTSPSQAAIRDEQSEQLSTALERLAPLDREILALRHFEEIDECPSSRGPGHRTTERQCPILSCGPQAAWHPRKSA